MHTAALQYINPAANLVERVCTCSRLPLSVHTPMLPSMDPENRSLALVAYAKHVTMPLWTVCVRSSCPVFKSHTCAMTMHSDSLVHAWLLCCWHMGSIEQLPRRGLLCCFGTASVPNCDVHSCWTVSAVICKRARIMKVDLNDSQGGPTLMALSPSAHVYICLLTGL